MTNRKLYFNNFSPDKWPIYKYMRMINTNLKPNISIMTGGHYIKYRRLKEYILYYKKGYRLNQNPRNGTLDRLQ